MNENGQKIVNCRQGQEELCIASWARWDAQLKGLVELERRCQDTRQEMQVFSERQEIFQSAVEDKLKLQCRTNERYHDQIVEEINETEQNKTEEALRMVQKKHDKWRYQNEREEPRILQSSGNSRRARGWTCSIPPLLMEPPRKRPEWLEWEEARGREEDARRLEPEEETEVPETVIVADEVEGTCVDSNGEGHHGRGKVENHRCQSGAQREEGEEFKSPKRKVIRVASEETQDYVREAKSGSVFRKKKLCFRSDNQCSEKTLSFWHLASMVN